MRRETGDPSLRSEHDTTLTIKSLLTTSIIRPARMLILSPIVFLLSFYVAVVFAYTYILFTTITEIFILSISAMSAEVERVFSGAKITIDDKRQRL